jgi:hypothetical protein
MNIKHTVNVLFGRLPCTGLKIVIAAALALASPAPGSTIGLHFLYRDNVGNTNGNALAATDLAGVPAYAQTNWNNLSTAIAPGSNQMATNRAVIDSSGAATTVAVSWSCPDNYTESGGNMNTQGTPDGNLMNPFLDNLGNANVGITNPFNMFDTTVNYRNDWPLVYLTGLKAWMTAQGVAAYDVVIYCDGDATSGRVGEYWAVNASGTPTALTLGADASTHIFACDLNNFISVQAYSAVSASIQTGNQLPNVSGGLIAEYGNFPGDYLILTSLTNDTVLFRTQRYNSRAPINAIQIIPRATVLPATFYSQYDAPVYAGGTARFAPAVAGGTPITFQWQKNGVGLTDSGNIYGSATSALIVSNAGGGDVASYSLVVTNPVGVITSAPMALTIVVPVAGSYPEKISTNLPYAYWRFNETADPFTGFAPAYDYVGGFTATYGIAAQNGYNAAVGPVPTDFPGFESGNLAYTSSRNARQTYLLARPLLLNTNTVTMCAWIYPTAAQGGATALIAARNGNDVGAFGYGNNNNLGYTWNSNSAATYNYASGLVPLTNAWSFVALTISPTNAIIYLYNTNGQLTATNAIVHTVEGMSGPTFIGGDIQGASIATPQTRSFVGSIDELAIFNRTLPQTEIYNLYKKGLGLSAIGPSIPVQPQPLALFEGRKATFNITASGDTPLTIKWRKNGGNMSDGPNISGSASTSLTITNVTIATDAANYDVVVGNIVGSITSSVVSLTVVVSNSVPAPYEAKLRSLNPIAYWRLNETNGSPYSYDYWGGNIATSVGSLNLGVAGPVPPDFSGMETTNTAGWYDGATAASDSSVSLMNNRSQFSIIGWFNAAGIEPARTGLFGQNDVCEFGFHSALADGLAEVGIWTPSAAAFLDQSNIIAGVWYLVAAVGSGTNVSLTLVSTNGAGGFQVLQSSTAGVTTNYGTSPFNFHIGGDGVLDPTGNFFNGLIDEVAVFNRALSIGELSDLFGAALLGGDLPPGISIQPVSQTLYAGRTATFSVSAVGTSPHYQWRTNGVPVGDQGNLSGSATPSLTLTSVTAANQMAFDLVITNHVGSITSSVVTLTVITPSTGSYEAATISLNPWAYYRLNEISDPTTNPPAHDFWGGHDGVYQIAAQNGFNGVYGPTNPPFFGFNDFNTAMETFITTASSYVTAPIGSLSTNTVTFTAWIYPIGLQESWAGLLVNRNSGVAGGWSYNDQQMFGYTWNNNTTWSYASGLIPLTNAWNFVACSISPSQAILYLANSAGVFTATNVLAHTSDVFGNNWQIGHDNLANADNGARNFNGVIDEVAVYTQTLSPSQIQSLINAGGVGPVVLSIQQSGQNAVVTWPRGTLLESTNIAGPWSTNNATSPYTTPASADQQFYKVIVH